MVLLYAQPEPLPEAGSRHMHTHQITQEMVSQHDAFVHPFKVESSSALGHQFQQNSSVGKTQLPLLQKSCV